MGTAALRKNGKDFWMTKTGLENPDQSAAQTFGEKIQKTPAAIKTAL